MGQNRIADAQVLVESIDPYLKKRSPVRLIFFQYSFYTLIRVQKFTSLVHSSCSAEIRIISLIVTPMR